jgi:Protein of unknown function (DUF3572)
MARPVTISREAAETLAIQALTYLAGEPERLARFLASTGIGPDSLRAAAREPLFLAGVLDHLATDEALLTDFAVQANIDPLAVGEARGVLSRKERSAS